MNNNTIDLIVQAAYKTRVITKRSRTLFGQALYAAGHDSRLAVVSPTLHEIRTGYPAFTPFERRYKRTAVNGAIECFIQDCARATGWEDSEVKRLVEIVAEKNARQAGFLPVIEHGTDEDGEATETVVKTGHQVMWDTTASNHSFYDISDHQRDPESDDYADNVMVRPIEVIQAEREVEREAIRQQRMAADAERMAERMAEQAVAVARESDDADDDDDDWDDLD